MRFTADQLVALLDAHDRFHLRPCGEGFQGLMGAFVTDGADDRAGHAVDGMGLVTQPADLAEDLALLGRAGAGFEDDDHGKCCSLVLKSETGAPQSARSFGIGMPLRFCSRQQEDELATPVLGPGGFVVIGIGGTLLAVSDGLDPV